MRVIEPSERKLVVQMMRLGYGVHPDRDIVIINDERFKEGELHDALKAVSQRYSEDDFILFYEHTNDSVYEEDNVYELINLPSELSELLSSVAVLNYDAKRAVDVETFKAEVKEGLKKEGFNREGTTMIAVDDDDTTRKLVRDCRSGECS